MKNSNFVLRVFILNLILVTFSFAQKTVVRQNGTLTAIYTSNNPFIDAYSNSNNGDTIFLPGGFFNVPNSVNKRLVIIGAGIYPDSTIYTGKTVLNSAFAFGLGSDSTLLSGVEINGDIIFDLWSKIEKIKIIRCKFNNLHLNTGYNQRNYFFIQGCIFNEMYGNGWTSQHQVNYLTISNCIITDRIADLAFGGLIQNNIFLRDQNTSTQPHIFNTHNSIIQNNIFYNNNNTNIGNFGNNNQILKNVFALTPSSYGTNFASGNYTNVPQNTILVNAPANTFTFSANYHLQSPTTYLGTDNTQVGIYGGSIGPFKEGAVPFNPHIYYKSVSPTTNSGGQLQIQFKVSAQTN
jgi:hypothetical protein